MKRIGRTLRGRGGYTLIELLAVLTIFLIVVSALTTLFVSGAKAELDANRRFQAQLSARVAFDQMRREIHCASSLTFTSAASVTITLPPGCPSAGGNADDRRLRHRFRRDEPLQAPPQEGERGRRPDR